MSPGKFGSISPERGMKDVLEVFMPFVKEENYPAGKTIFEEGLSDDRFFIIKKGEVEIRKVMDRNEGKYKQISVLSEGEFFGEMAVFLGHPRSADAVARTDVTLLKVSKKDFASLFRDNPESSFRVMEVFTAVLMDRLRNTTGELALVYEIGKLIASAHTMQELYEYVMESLFKAVDSAEAGLFVRWNEFNGDYEVCYEKGFEQAGFIQPDDCLIKWFEENEDAFLSFDMENEKRLPQDNSIYHGRSMVAAPFFSEDRLTGFILLLNRSRQNAFTYNQMILLSATSGYVSVALDNLKFMQEEIDRSRLSRAKSSITL